jgi:hypothetical protein
MRALNCSRSAVHPALGNGLNPPKSCSRHLVVDAESDTNIFAWIKKQAEKNAAVKRTDIKNYCHTVCRLEVPRGWVESFILRHSTEATEKKSSPQESRVCKFRESSSRKQDDTQYARNIPGLSSRLGI